MTKEALVYLDHRLLASKCYWWTIQEGLGANFPQPLININGCMLPDFCLLTGICYWVLPDPHVQQQHPLLQGEPRFVEKAIFSDALSGITLWAIPANSVRHIVPWPLDHWSIWTPTCIAMSDFVWLHAVTSSIPCTIHCTCQQVVLPEIGNDAWCPTKDDLPKLEKRHRLLRSSGKCFPRAGIFVQWMCSGVDERDRLQKVGRARWVP